MALRTLPTQARLGIPSVPRPTVRSGTALLVGAATLTGAAIWNNAQARQAERRHPPLGRFINVDGVRVHYVERGRGRPVVLLHGNIAMIEDLAVSGLLDLAAERHHVVAFDRPGFGRTARPRDRVWTAAAQADLIHAALRRLGIEQPIVVGHSYGTIVALELALRHPTAVAALTLLSGYYFPTTRIDVPFQASPAIPVLGDVMRHTVSPLLGRLAWPGLLRLLFDPAPAPADFAALRDLVMRPEQIRATASEYALMVPTVAALQRHYVRLRLPVVIAGGTEDRYIGTEEQSGRLHRVLPHSDYRPVSGVGHMLHHTAPREAMALIDLAVRRADERTGHLGL